jgi:monoterpene epsilon-lactone hydrolase
MADLEINRYPHVKRFVHEAIQWDRKRRRPGQCKRAMRANVLSPALRPSAGRKGAESMADPEMDAIRALLVARPRPADLSERRARLDGLGTVHSLPPDVSVVPVTFDGIAGEWTSTPQADRSRVLLFFHGGGYISGSLNSHRHMIAQAGREAGVRTFAVEYRLAPEFPFPAALDDALAAYRFLQSSGIRPDRIGAAGESAGGGLVIAMLMKLRDARADLPACVWCSSPWVDLEMSGATMTTKAAVDPLISRPYLSELAAAYLAGADPRGPLVSPIYGNLAGLPPMLIQSGSTETLLDDALRLAAVAGAADVRVTLEIWPDMIHAWHLFYQQVAAGRRALAAVGAFVRGALDAAAKAH